VTRLETNCRIFKCRPVRRSKWCWSLLWSACQHSNAFMYVLTAKDDVGQSDSSVVIEKERLHELSFAKCRLDQNEGLLYSMHTFQPNLIR